MARTWSGTSWSARIGLIFPASGLRSVRAPAAFFPIWAVVWRDGLWTLITVRYVIPEPWFATSEPGGPTSFTQMYFAAYSKFGPACADPVPDGHRNAAIVATATSATTIARTSRRRPATDTGAMGSTPFPLVGLVRCTPPAERSQSHIDGSSRPPIDSLPRRRRRF